MIGVIGLLAGCGSSASPDQATIGRLVRGYDSALVSGDYRTACADSSSHVQAALIFGAHAARLIPATVTDCPSALGKLMVALTRRGVTAAAVAKGITIGTITVHGDHATIAVTLAYPGRPIAHRTSRAVKEHGSWKIDVNQPG